MAGHKGHFSIAQASAEEWCQKQVPPRVSEKQGGKGRSSLTQEISGKAGESGSTAWVAQKGPGPCASSLLDLSGHWGLLVPQQNFSYAKTQQVNI